MADKKLDLFKEVLPALYARDFDFYERLSEEDKKSVTPVTIMRWLTGISGGAAEPQITIVNKFVNAYFKDLSGDPDMMWRLMCASTILHTKSRNIPRHQWIAGPKRSSTTNKIDKLLLDKYPYMNDIELSILRSKFTVEALTDFLKDMGWSDKDIKEMVTEFKKSNG